VPRDVAFLPAVASTRQKGKRSNEGIRTFNASAVTKKVPKDTVGVRGRKLHS